MSTFQNKISVMIVEDDPMVRTITEGFLKKIEGVRLVGSYDNLKEAKLNIEKLRPDLLLLDVFFPHDKGIELLKWIRKHNFYTDVIFITADNSTLTIEEARRFGAIDYLLKPFRLERLNDAILRFREIKQIADKSKELSQKDVDSFLEITKGEDENKDSGNVSREGEISKDTSLMNLNRTYALIYEFLQSNKETGYTAKEVGVKLGVARITARRYLDQMEVEGIIEVTQVYGSVGRPQNYYRMVGKG